MISEWNKLPIRDLALKITKGTTPSKKDGGFSDYGINYIKSESVSYDGSIDITKFAFITEEVHEKLRRSQLQEDDILFSMAGVNLGKVGLVDKSHLPANTNQALALIRPNKKLIYPKFLLYSLQKPEVCHFASNATSQSAQPNINLKDIGSIEVSLPDLETQIDIADKIDVLTIKIVLNRQINQTLEEMAQAIFKSWFVDFEPVKAKIKAKQAGGNVEQIQIAAMCAISGKTEAALANLPQETLTQLKTTANLFPEVMQDSELGEIPVGWGELPLYDTAEYVNGAAFKSEDFSVDGSGLPIVKIVELKNGISSNTKFSNLEFKEKYFITNEDVLYSWSGSPETSLEVFKWFGGDAWLNQHIFKLNFESDSQKYFTFYLLKQMKPILIETAKQKQTTGLGHITVADMKRIKVAYPSLELLETFKERISSIYKKSSSLEQENIQLSEVRDVLLQKLLNGEISLEYEVLA